MDEKQKELTEQEFEELINNTGVTTEEAEEKEEK